MQAEGGAGGDVSNPGCDPEGGGTPWQDGVSEWSDLLSITVFAPPWFFQGK